MPSLAAWPELHRRKAESRALRTSCIRSGFRLAKARALVAQLDRVLDYESRGRGFESSPARQ